MAATSRKLALALGESRYFTGKPCLRGHVAERSASRGVCVECHRQVCAEWRTRNPETQKSYHAANRERISARTREWKRANRHLTREADRRYRETHAGAHAALQKAWREKNAERDKERRAKWAAKNRAKINAQAAARRAAKVRATPKWANRAYIDLFYQVAKLERERIGQAVEVDHIVPLISDLVCGLHVEDNLQLLVAVENRRKSNTAWPDHPDSGTAECSR